MRIVYFGTPLFAAQVLRYLLERKVEIVGVISKPDKAVGRSKELQPVAVKIVAEEYQIPIFQPEKVSAPEFASTLATFEADLFVVVAYGEILKQHVLDMPKTACINLHASLLPKYRGAAPIQRAIINGEKESGVTIMHMVRKMDAGDMITQIKTPILPEMTYGELEKELCSIGSESLLQVIKRFSAGGNNQIPQNEEEATLAPKIELKDCQINWNSDAKAIHNLIRGVNPEPGAWCLIKQGDQTKRLKIFASRPHHEMTLAFGTIQFDKRLLIGCGQGVLELLEVQLEGKKRMGAADFYRGLPAGSWTLAF